MFVSLTPLGQFTALLALHWIGDFVLQSNWMATSKGKALDALLLHVSVYTFVLLTGAAVIFGANSASGILLFIVSNGILHFITDFVTSRMTARLWEEKNWRAFFVMIGLDQLIHQVTLAATMWFFLI